MVITVEPSTDVIEHTQAVSLSVEDLLGLNGLDTNTVYYGVTRKGKCLHAGMLDDRMIQEGKGVLIVAFCSSWVMLSEPSPEYPIYRSKSFCASCDRKTAHILAEKIRASVRDGNTIYDELFKLAERAETLGMGASELIRSVREIAQREQVNIAELLSFQKWKDRPSPASQKLIERIS